MQIRKLKIVDIVGARPQFIKLAPVLKAIENHNRQNDLPEIKEVLVHTGQHYDYEMSQVFFEDLGLKAPDYHLGVGSGTHGHQTGEMLKRIEEVLLQEKPGLVMVYGDTNTTLAGALAAVKLHIPVAHVEAGLRAFNRKIPEEINRILTDHVSSLLFCPTETAVENLRGEGITEGVHLVGDVMYDAVLQYSELAERKSRILETLGLQSGAYALATVHRAENTDTLKRLQAILQGLKAVSQDGLPVIFPIHPRTRKQMERLNLEANSVRVMEPVSYLDMLLLEKNARVIFTDSGGVQKEAYWFKVPCVTLREETEWVETVEEGWNVLVGYEPERINSAVKLVKDGHDNRKPYGDGQTAEKIVNILLHGK